MSIKCKGNVEYQVLDFFFKFSLEGKLKCVLMFMYINNT